MAERRMFAKTIIDSDAFLDMPLSAQALYFHLSMRADDDGFVNNPKKIQRSVGAAEDDLKLLALKKFVIPFESGVCVIKHWFIHNYIRGDRYKHTVYHDERKMLSVKENKAYTVVDAPASLPPSGMSLGIPDNNQMVDKWETQDRLGKDRLGKDRLGKDRLNIQGDDVSTAENPPTTPHPRINYIEIQDLFNSLCPSFPKCTALSDARKKAIKARFMSGKTIEDFEQLFIKAEQSNFLKGANNRNWTANFDWLIKDANMAKVLDGNYDNHSQTTTTAFEPSGNVFMDMLKEERERK